MQIFDIAGLGTSLTRGNAYGYTTDWPRLMLQSLAAGSSNRVRYYNFGVPGVTSASVLAQSVIARRPKATVVELLMNDCATANSISVAQSLSNHQSLIDSIRANNPDVIVFLATMNNPIDGAVSGRPNIEDYNQMYRDLAVSYATELIDIAPAWSDAVSADIPDGIHPIMDAQRARTVPAVVAAIRPFVDL